MADVQGAKKRLALALEAMAKQGARRFGELRAKADAGECPFDGLAGYGRMCSWIVPPVRR